MSYVVRYFGLPHSTATLPWKFECLDSGLNAAHPVSDGEVLEQVVGGKLGGVHSYGATIPLWPSLTCASGMSKSCGSPLCAMHAGQCYACVPKRSTPISQACLHQSGQRVRSVSQRYAVPGHTVCMTPLMHGASTHMQKALVHMHACPLVSRLCSLGKRQVEGPLAICWCRHGRYPLSILLSYTHMSTLLATGA